MRERGKIKNTGLRNSSSGKSNNSKKFDMFNYSPSHGPLEEYLSKRNELEELFIKNLKEDNLKGILSLLEKVKNTNSLFEFLIKNSYKLSSINVLRFFWNNRERFSLSEDELLGKANPHIFGCVNNLSFLRSFYEIIGERLFSLSDRSGNRFIVYTLASQTLDVFNFIYEKKSSAFREKNLFSKENIMHNIALLSFELNFFIKIKEKFEFLIEKGFEDLLSSPDIYGNLPLHFAISVKNIGFVEKAFNVLGKDDAWFYENKYGETPIDLIFKGDDFEVPLEVRKKRASLFLFLMEKGLIKENKRRKEIRSVIKDFKMSRN